MAEPDLTAPAAATHRRAWRAARITPYGEVLSPPRLTATAIRLAVQVFLAGCLWGALYSHTSSSAGLTREQAVSYAVLAALAARIRNLDRAAGRDTITQHLRFGTIVYWFLRPLPPRTYYAIRALGDQLYGFVWVLAGYLVCRACHMVAAPASAGAALAFAAALILGQLVLYHIMLIIDLVCFWALRNNGATMILQLTQNMLSGVYAPLWFFPGWFVTLSGFLPFQATLNIPLSLYIGRIPVSEAPHHLAVQAGWVVTLALFTRWLWHRAGLRIVSQGG